MTSYTASLRLLTDSTWWWARDSLNYMALSFSYSDILDMKFYMGGGGGPVIWHDWGTIFSTSHHCWPGETQVYYIRDTSLSFGGQRLEITPTAPLGFPSGTLVGQSILHIYIILRTNLVDCIAPETWQLFSLGQNLNTARRNKQIKVILMATGDIQRWI